MAALIAPALIDALVAAAEDALPAVLVIDGIGATDDPGDYLMVGVDDTETDEGAFAARGAQKWAHTGPRVRDDVGTLTCAAFSWNGDGNQKAARDAVDAIASAVVALCVADPTLGVPSVQWTTPMTDYNLSQIQGEAGASALLVFTIDYHARF